MPHAKIANALTVDVEDYFQVSAFDSRVRRTDWDHFECRVEKNTEKLLELFADANVKATFFVLGWIAERYPALINRIHQSGHEIASHGYWHHLIYRQSENEFRQDIRKSLDVIGDATGLAVTMYRAPSFSITKRSWWALNILAELGIRVDSSVFPIAGHDRYGCPDAPKQIHDITTDAGTIREFPPSSWSKGKIHVPIGGGYFRLFPLSVTLRAMDAIRRQGRPAMFYLHPWEIDPEQPRIDGISFKSRFRHRVGLGRTESKLKKMLAAQPFDTMSNVLDAAQAQPGEVSCR